MSTCSTNCSVLLLPVLCSTCICFLAHTNGNLDGGDLEDESSKFAVSLQCVATEEQLHVVISALGVPVRRHFIPVFESDECDPQR